MAVKRVLVEHLLHFFLILALSGSSICSEVCARNFSTPFGVISSPNYPKNYTNNLSCVYFITQPVGSKITLTFHDFALDTSNGLRDYVEVFDGQFPTTSKLLGNFSYSWPLIIRSKQNIVRITFKTDRSNVNKGFNASYDTGCEIHFFDRKGVISSPNHAKNYDSDLTCVYVIKQPAGYTITLKFSYFQLEDSSKCTADYVEIRDGESPTSPMLGGPYCGSLIPPLQMTTQNAMRVTFKTNGDITSRGFKASFNAECGGNFNMSAGVISSPYYPKHYTNNLACEYVIKGPPGSKITLAFHDFNLEGKNCSSDYIEVRDGNSSVSPLLTERFCGDMMPPVLRTNQNIMRIFFKTNSLHVFQGFNASFAAGETKFPFIDCEIDFYGERGVISSPNYPQDLAINLSCVYVIRQPIGYIVTLNFSDYCLETNASSTFFEFRDGESWSSPLIENPRCGDTTPFLKTSQNNMWIHFKSIEGAVSKGFKATFTTAMDRCSSPRLHTCPAHSSCYDTGIRYVCTCDKGFFENGTKCERRIRLTKHNHTPYEGQLELYIDDAWTTVCVDKFKPTEAGVVCAQLGYTKRGAEYFSYKMDTANMSVTASAYSNVYSYNFRCTGRESFLTDCANESRNYSCSQNETVSIKCDAECNDNHYYGPNCTELCTCSVNNTKACRRHNGSCICKEGWEGGTCDDDVDECASKLHNCESVHEICENVVPGFRCDCAAHAKRNTSGVCIGIGVRLESQNSTYRLVVIVSSAAALVVFAVLTFLVYMAWRQRCQGRVPGGNGFPPSSDLPTETPTQSRSAKDALKANSKHTHPDDTALVGQSEQKV